MFRCTTSFRLLTLILAVTVRGASGREGDGDFAAQPTPATNPSPVIVIERVLPFAEADRVHIEAVVRHLHGKGTCRLGLTATITYPENDEILWEGPINVITLQDDSPVVVRRTVGNLKPRLWSLSEQPFHALSVVGTWKDTASVRKTVPVAFRSFDVRRGLFHLNGKPIFLRGVALNPPLPCMREGVARDEDFARAYVRQLKQLNVNCIRTRGDAWLKACDMEGMLAVTGCFGPPPGSTVQGDVILPPEDVEATIETYKRRYFMRDALHPSVVIHVLSQKIPNIGRQGRAFHDLFSRAYRELKRWDPGRLVVSNAGTGDDRWGDLIDVHVYSGWYEGTFVDYLRLSRELLEPMPVLLSECVGAATGPADRFRADGAELGPSLAWGGHSGRDGESAIAYQGFLLRQAIESTRCLRARNQRLAGIMPMTPLFRHWRDVVRFEDMQPSPAAERIALAYSPVLLSLESWRHNIYAGETLTADAHIVNDSNDFDAVRSNGLTYAVVDRGGRTVTGKEQTIPDTPYYASHRHTVRLDLPPRMPTGRYLLAARVTSGSNVVAETAHDIFVAQRSWTKPDRPPRHIAAVYDPSGMTMKALAALGMPAIPVTDVTSLVVERGLVIGAGSWDSVLSAQRLALAEKVRKGGRVLLLLQSPEAYESDWLPVPLDVRLKKQHGWTPGIWINPERSGHPVFSRVKRYHLRLWSDPRGWNTNMAGYPHVFPAWLALRAKNRADLGRLAVLANSGIGLADVCLCEMFDGDGSVLVSSLDCVSRSHTDPVAARMLMNLVLYTADPGAHVCRVRVEDPVCWGDYASERGLITGPLHGFVVNAAYEDVEKADAADGFASRQSVPRGRRAIGPFEYNEKCLVVEADPESEQADAVFHAEIVEGCSRMITSVENPSETKAVLSIDVNGRTDGPRSVAAGATAEVKTTLPHGTKNVDVRYTASKALVFLKTAFE